MLFRDRFNAHDFLYRDKLEPHHSTVLHTAFSRDQAEKFYVQDCVCEQGEGIWALLENEAEIYVCGSKANLGKSLDATLCHIAQIHGNMDTEVADQWLFTLRSSERYHQDLY